MEKYRSSTEIWNALTTSFSMEMTGKIQDILDAKAGRIEESFQFGNGLPKKTSLEIAGMMGLAVDRLSKSDLEEQILHKIEEENSQKNQ